VGQDIKDTQPEKVADSQHVSAPGEDFEGGERPVSPAVEAGNYVYPSMANMVESSSSDSESDNVGSPQEKAGQAADVLTDSSQFNSEVTLSAEMSTASSSDSDSSELSDVDYSSRDDERDDEVFIDNASDEVLLYSGADFTIYDMAEVLNQLQRVNNQSASSTNRIYSVIKALLPSSDKEFPTLPQLRTILLKNVARVHRIHACAQDCVLFIGENKF
jgi:hypothetical protein